MVAWGSFGAKARVICQMFIAAGVEDYRSMDNVACREFKYGEDSESAPNPSY